MRGIAYRIPVPGSRAQGTSNADRPACAMVAAYASVLRGDQPLGILRGQPQADALRQVADALLAEFDVPTDRLNIWAESINGLTIDRSTIPAQIQGLTLETFQRDAVARMSPAGGGLALGCGLGKTLAACAYAHAIAATSVVILCPLNAMPTWKRYASFLPVVPVIHSMDSAHHLLAMQPVDLIIYDECFTYTTVVETSTGPVPIGAIVEGRMPVQVRVADGSYVAVTGYLKKPCAQKMLAVDHEQGVLVCTPNHPVYTEEDGYVRADQLCPHHHTLRYLRENRSAPPEDARLRPAILQPALQQAQTRGMQPGISGPHAPTEPYVDAGGEGADTTDQEAERDRRVSGPTWWEREDITNRGTIRQDVPLAGVGGVSRDTKGNTRAIHAAPGVEGRLRGCYPEVGYRIGWGKPSGVGDPGGRPQEGCRVTGVRVVSVADQESLGHRPAGAGAPNGGHVYCLEVAGHGHFYADGVLVHNCHLQGHFTAARTKNAHTLRLRSKAGLCLTGTLLHAGIIKSLSVQDLAIPGSSGFGNRWAAGEHFHCLVRKVIGGRTVTEVGHPPLALRAKYHEYLAKYTVALTPNSEAVRAVLQLPGQDVVDVPVGEPWVPIEQAAADLVHAAIARGEPIPSASSTAHALCQEGVETKTDWVMQNLGDDPAVIFAAYTETLDMMGRKLTDAGISFVRVDGSVTGQERIDAQEQFQTGKVQVFLGQIIAAGISMDLFRTPYSICIDHPWRSEAYAQALARTHRRGQAQKCTHWDLFANKLQKRIIERLRAGEAFNAETADWQQIKLATDAAVVS